MSHPVPWQEDFLPEDDSDRWHEEVGKEEEMIERANRDCALLEAHKKWVKEFNEKWEQEKEHAAQH